MNEEELRRKIQSLIERARETGELIPVFREDDLATPAYHMTADEALEWAEDWAEDIVFPKENTA